MKRIFLGIIVGLAAGAVAMWFYQRHSAPQAKPEKRDETPKEQSLVHHGLNGETFLKLDDQTQTRMGLKLEPLSEAHQRVEPG